MYIFYKRVNRRNEECENCGKPGVRIMIVRWVYPGVGSYVAGININPTFYCSLQCARENEDGGKFVQVKENTIDEINELGYIA